MKALILVDIQIDFLPGGSLEVPGGDEIIPVVNQLQSLFDLVVATQDWHPANHKSFASNHRGKKPYDIIDLHGIEQILWPDHCVQGSRGADFPPGLDMNKAEIILRKGTDPEIDSYGAFYDNGHLKTTGLAGYLREKKVEEIYLTGLAQDICVFVSAMDGISEQFSTYIVEDATRPLSLQENERTMKIFREKGGSLIGSHLLLSVC